MWNKHQAGVTLVELIVAIIIIGIAVAGVLQVFNIGAIASADPIVTKQLRAVAEGMMDEIQRQPFAIAANGASSNACARDTFNDVFDYNGYAPGAICLVTGDAVPALAGMTITVEVVADGVTLGITPADASRIKVETSKAGKVFTLYGWRTNYAKGVPE